MDRARELFIELFGRISPKWRKRILLWLAVFIASKIFQTMWGTGAWLSALVIASILGALLYSAGMKSAKLADNLLANVWGYFRGAIVAALLPALWQAMLLIFKGTLLDGVLELAIMGVLIAVVFEKFNQLPKSMSKLLNRR